MEPLLPRFENLGKTLRKAGMEVSLRMYLSMAVTVTIIAAIVGLPAALGIVYLFTQQFLWWLIILVGVLVPLVTMLGFYIYPPQSLLST